MQAKFFKNLAGCALFKKYEQCSGKGKYNGRCVWLGGNIRARLEEIPFFQNHLEESEIILFKIHF